MERLLFINWMDIENHNSSIDFTNNHSGYGISKGMFHLTLWLLCTSTAELVTNTAHFKWSIHFIIRISGNYDIAEQTGK